MYQQDGEFCSTVEIFVLQMLSSLKEDLYIFFNTLQRMQVQDVTVMIIDGSR